MPYISKSARERITDVHFFVNSPGELNYFLTRTITGYLGPEPKYEDYNAVIGVLECAKLELYRRMVAPYEDRKCAENGDVYPIERN